jgi:hypothetical protein
LGAAASTSRSSVYVSGKSFGRLVRLVGPHPCNDYHSATWDAVAKARRVLY